MEEYVYTVKFIKSFRPFYNKKVPEIQEFLELYTDIEKKDFIKPIYSETNKYNSFPSFSYNKKHNGGGSNGGYHKGGHKGHYGGHKGHHGGHGGHGGGKKGKKSVPVFMKKGSNAWQPYTPSSNGEKIKKIVISNFNKLTGKNFEQVSDKLIADLSEIDCSDVLTILGAEVLKKLLFDKGFYKVYVDLCKKIWSLEEWHDRLVTIIEDDGVLYWSENKINVDEDQRIMGPYDSIDELRLVTRREVSFKRYLMNMLYSEFCRIDEYLEEMGKAVSVGDEDTEFRFRRKMFSNGEFLAELYKDGCVDEKILNIYFIFLLGMQDFDEKQVNTIKLELFSKMWTIIDGKIGSQGDILAHIKGRLLKMKLANRIRFMLEDSVGAVRKAVSEDTAFKNEKSGFGSGSKKGWDGSRGGSRGGRRDGQRDGRRDGSRGGRRDGRKDNRRDGRDNRFGGVWNRFGDGVAAVKGGSGGSVGSGGSGGSGRFSEPSGERFQKREPTISDDEFFEKCDEKIMTFLGNYESGKSEEFIDEERENLVDEFRKMCVNIHLGKVLLEALLNKALESDETIDRISPLVSALLKRKVLRRKYIGAVFKELEGNLDDIVLDIPEAKGNFERLRGTKF